jgi:hypothetical protein
MPETFVCSRKFVWSDQSEAVFSDQSGFAWFNEVRRGGNGDMFEFVVVLSGADFLRLNLNPTIDLTARIESDLRLSGPA